MDSETTQIGQGLEIPQEKSESRGAEPLTGQHEVEELKNEHLSTQKQATPSPSPVKNLLLPG